MFDLPDTEIPDRRARLREELLALELDGVTVFYGHAVTYLTGFLFIPTERPIVYLQARDGTSALIVPELEEAHARGTARVERVASYDEYPGDRHPIQVVRAELDAMGLAAAGRRLGVDHDGYPPVWGYSGPPLSELVAARLVPLAGVLDRLMMVKSDYEVALMRESSRWAIRAHELLQAYTRVGLTETEVALRASADATAELAAAIPGYTAGHLAGGARAGYRGQIGRRGALPHSLGANVRFQPGDTLVTGASAPMWGYGTELERTMFIGSPGPEQHRLFGHMVALQEIGLAAIRPGVRAAEVDDAVRAYFEREGLWGYWRHHVGHGLGLRYHEAPFLDRGDGTVLEAGMILSVEPGLYDPVWGGFRHSDTVRVTADGVELLTGAYPRDLESLVIAETLQT
jgi:Xaa-Pro aminopeptidase